MWRILNNEPAKKTIISEMRNIKNESDEEENKRVEKEEKRKWVREQEKIEWGKEKCKRSDVYINNYVFASLLSFVAPLVRQNIKKCGNNTILCTFVALSGATYLVIYYMYVGPYGATYIYNF